MLNLNLRVLLLFSIGCLTRIENKSSTMWFLCAYVTIYGPISESQKNAPSRKVELHTKREESRKSHSIPC